MSTIPSLLPTALAETGTVSSGETLLFWIVAPVMVIAAAGLLFARRAVYAALSVIVVMLGLAFLYVAQDAPFLGVAQVVVYTGAIMMLFLFVLMLVGVDASDSLHETIKGQRGAAVLAGIGLAVLLVALVGSVTLPEPQGLAAANADSNPVGVARLIFSDHVLTMELTGALLIVAAVGAVTFTHRDRLGRKVGQEDLADAKMRAYAAGQGHVGQLPAPGVYSRSTSATVPALSGTGGPIEESVPRVIRIRGQQLAVGEVSPEAVRAATEERAGTGPGLHGPATSAHIDQAGLPGMPGRPAPAPVRPGTDVAARPAATEEGER